MSPGISPISRLEGVREVEPSVRQPLAARGHGAGEAVGVVDLDSLRNSHAAVEDLAVARGTDINTRPKDTNWTSKLGL